MDIMHEHEDVFIYIDLTKEILKKKDLIKSTKNYIIEKKKRNPNGHFGLLIFQIEGNPIFITDKTGSEIIVNAIDENWKNRPKSQSYFENGLFYIFSYIAETIRKKSKIYRIIIITDTPSDLSEEYTEALFNLVSKIKNFPTFIDIIRISEDDKRFFKDDVKLNILASDTKGSIFYVKNKKEFSKIMENLIKRKQPVDIFTDREFKVRINREDYDFYSNLARKLISSPKDVPGIKCSFCNDEVCPLCADITDIPLKCSNCETTFHKCCITNYAIENNIGIPHIFRCPNCNILTQIDQDEIVTPEDPLLKSAEEYITEVETTPENEYMEMYRESMEYSSEYEEQDEPEITESQHYYENNEKTIRIGGFFGKTYTVKKEGDKIVYSRAMATEQKDSIEDVVHQEQKEIVWKPPEIERENSSFVICPSCGQRITFKDQIGICTSCGKKI